MKKLSDRVSCYRRAPFRFLGLFEFETKRKIGSGGFSEVFEVEHTTSKTRYCLKQMDLSALDEPNFVNIEHELRIQSSLGHKNIVELVDFFFETESLFLVLELCPKGNLFRHLNSRGSLPESEIAKIFSEVCEAVAVLHSRRIVQRDIKPENVLLSASGEAKICDFGWAVEEGTGSFCRAKAGTCAYMSPEALRGQNQTTRSDVWSLGVLLYELFHNREPFPGSVVSKQLEVVRTTRLEFSDRVTPNARDLIEICLKMEPADRPSVAEILDHSFLRQQTSDRAARKLVSRSTEPVRPQQHYFAAGQTPPAGLAAVEIPKITPQLSAPLNQPRLVQTRQMTESHNVLAASAAPTHTKSSMSVGFSNRTAFAFRPELHSPSPFSNVSNVSRQEEHSNFVKFSSPRDNLYSKVSPQAPPMAPEALFKPLRQSDVAESSRPSTNPFKLSLPSRALQENSSTPSSVEKVITSGRAVGIPSKIDVNLIPTAQTSDPAYPNSARYIVYAKPEAPTPQKVFYSPREQVFDSSVSEKELSSGKEYLPFRSYTQNKVLSSSSIIHGNDHSTPKSNFVDERRASSLQKNFISENREKGEFRIVFPDSITQQTAIHHPSIISHQVPTYTSLSQPSSARRIENPILHGRSNQSSNFKDFPPQPQLLGASSKNWSTLTTPRDNSEQAFFQNGEEGFAKSSAISTTQNSSANIWIQQNRQQIPSSKIALQHNLYSQKATGAPVSSGLSYRSEFSAENSLSKTYSRNF